MRVRAKFVCSSITPGNGETKTYDFYPVTDDGTPENERYNRYTPGGRLSLTVDNPAVAFELNQPYYLDFTPALVAEALGESRDSSTSQNPLDSHSNPTSEESLRNGLAAEGQSQSSLHTDEQKSQASGDAQGAESSQSTDASAATEGLTSEEE